MFSEEFKNQLRFGKYSKWAVDLNESQLEAILWMIGEFGYRAGYVLPHLGGLRENEGSGRAYIALESLFRVVGGDRPDRETYTQRVRDFLAEVRGAIEDPDTLPALRWPIEWEGRLVGWMCSPQYDESVFGYSGRWIPNENGEEFLSFIVNPENTNIRVTVGGIPAFSPTPPDETGKIVFMIHVSPHNSI